jgi:hypothetical protein
MIKVQCSYKLDRILVNGNCYTLNIQGEIVTIISESSDDQWEITFTGESPRIRKSGSRSGSARWMDSQELSLYIDLAKWFMDNQHIKDNREEEHYK